MLRTEFESQLYMVKIWVSTLYSRDRNVSQACTVSGLMELVPRVETDETIIMKTSVKVPLWWCMPNGVAEWRWQLTARPTGPGWQLYDFRWVIILCLAGHFMCP